MISKSIIPYVPTGIKTVLFVMYSSYKYLKQFDLSLKKYKHEAVESNTDKADWSTYFEFWWVYSSL